jgi:hypothetical protein
MESRIAQAKNYFYRKMCYITSEIISLIINPLPKMFFWSIGTYRSETWTMGVREVRRLSYIN